MREQVGSAAEEKGERWEVNEEDRKEVALRNSGLEDFPLTSTNTHAHSSLSTKASVTEEGSTGRGPAREHNMSLARSAAVGVRSSRRASLHLCACARRIGATEESRVTQVAAPRRLAVSRDFATATPNLTSTPTTLVDGKQDESDVVVIGGGVVGLSLACSLSELRPPSRTAVTVHAVLTIACDSLEPELCHLWQQPDAHRSI